MSNIWMVHHNTNLAVNQNTMNYENWNIREVTQNDYIQNITSYRDWTITINENAGLSKYELKQNSNTYKYVINENSTSTKECSICLSKFKEHEDVSLLKCLHLFHKNCVEC